MNKLSYAFLAVACVAALTFATGAQAQPAGPQMSPEDKPYPPPGTALGSRLLGHRSQCPLMLLEQGFLDLGMFRPRHREES